MTQQRGSYGVACTADGKAFYYTAGAALWRSPISGGDPQRVPLAVNSQLEFAISHDGKRLAYTFQELTRTPMKKLAITSIDGGPSEMIFVVPGNSAGLAWSRDDKGLDYLVTRAGATNIWEQPVSGGEARGYHQLHLRPHIRFQLVDRWKTPAGPR